MPIAPISPIALPRLSHSDVMIRTWADALVRALQLELQRLGTPAGATGYALTAATPVRALNPTTATTLDLGQVVAALIIDLQNKGSIA